MKILTLSCNAQVLLDDEDYARIPKTGWYLSDAKHGNLERKTRYALHDSLGRMHRWILNLNDPTIIVDHIDGNGLNNQKSNLRIVSCSINKRNQKTTRTNSFNFNGISLEKGRQSRIKVSWSEGLPEWRCEGFRCKYRTKSFSLKKYNYDYNRILRDAVLFRIKVMKENEYLLDERSTTIEKILLQNEKVNMEEILNIKFSEIFE